MESHLNDVRAGSTPDQQVPIDPRRRVDLQLKAVLNRVYVPIEKRQMDGSFRFRTSDKRRYERHPVTGVIRRVDGDH
jgi:hypothetical protein